MRDEQRRQRLRMERQRVGLHAREVVGREPILSRWLAVPQWPGQEIDDALCPVRLVPFETEKVRIAGRRGTMIRRDDEVLRGIEEMRKLVERNPSGPLGLAARSIGRLRAVAARADRNVPRRVVPDVAVDVAVDEILRRDDEVAQRVRELIPVARFVELQEGQNGRVVGIERGPSQRERLDGRRFRFLL